MICMRAVGCQAVPGNQNGGHQAAKLGSHRLQLIFVLLDPLLTRLGLCLGVKAPPAGTIKLQAGGARLRSPLCRIAREFDDGRSMFGIDIKLTVRIALLVLAPAAADARIAHDILDHTSLTQYKQTSVMLIGDGRLCQLPFT
jgi:hypothetical protein